MKKFTILKRKDLFKGIKILTLFFFFYVFLVVLPVLRMIPSFLSGTHLILFTNEFEARPCGGFLTAFGVFSIIPFKYELKNAYHFKENSFGEAKPPLDNVASELKFWDLGTETNLSVCSSRFKEAYESMKKQEIKNVVLFNLGNIEKIIGFFGKIKTENTVINEKNFFSILSQKSANIDRHDEASLENRKKPASNLGKQMIKTLFLRPWVLPKITYFLAQKIKTGEIFIKKFSPEISPKKIDFSVIEWNLGGGKSSRFLRKKIKISAREVLPEKWEIDFDFFVDHLGGQNEPISQLWKGVFEFKFPDFLEMDPIFITQEIAPGTSFKKSFKKSYEGSLEKEGFSFFQPRGQKFFAEVSISLFPEKTFAKASFETHENIGYFFGKIENFRKKFFWTTALDKKAPFITLHEIITPAEELKESFTDSNLFAEIHFNEKVKLTKNFKVSLVDRNFENREVVENPVMKNFEFFSDQKTLLLGFSQNIFQKDERFYLQIKGISDFFGNEILLQNRTLITR